MLTDGEEFMDEVLGKIARRATEHDLQATWPQADLDDLARLGAMRWAIDPRFGGEGVDPHLLNTRYEHIAAAGLATALVLSQRDAAVGYLEASDNEPLKQDLLPRLARNELWTTIGISHLTTSHRSGTLTARMEGGDFILSGTIPWATGGAQADFILAGAKLDDGRQLMCVLPTDAAGVRVREPFRLATLSAAPTCPIDCAAVRLPADRVVAGPGTATLGRRKGGLPIGQAFAALGLTRAALRLIRQIDAPSAESTLHSLQLQFDELSWSVRDANARLVDDHDLQSGPLIRSECNNLALRATHAAVALYKGTGLRLDHPAQRLAREAMFLLVWSSPMSVTDRNLELISDSH